MGAIHRIALLGAVACAGMTGVQASESSVSACPAATAVAATYQVEQLSLENQHHSEHSSHQAKDKAGSIRHVTLWRSSDQVAFEYQETGITELWGDAPGDRLHLVRLFEQAKRGIEYQPGEIPASDTWETVSQLVSPELISAMTHLSDSGSGCDREEKYRLEDGSRSIELVWMPEQSLVKTYREHSPARHEHWSLESEITDKTRIEERFGQWLDYQTTDYADIGDNESDPFLMQMINLGFVEHGGSGFYNAHGQDIQGAHGHHH